MKNTLTIIALLLATTAFSQTYKSKKILTMRGIKSESHTLVLTADKVIYDNVDYKVTKTTKTTGTMSSDTYFIGEDRFTFTYNKGKIFTISYVSTKGSVTNTKTMYKPKQSK